MRKQSPAPTSTPLAGQTGGTNLPWYNWFRETSDYLVESTTEKGFGTQGLSYVNVGKICHIMLEGKLTIPTLQLPYIASNTKYMKVFVAGVETNVLLSKGNNTITLPINTDLVICDYYHSQLQ
jgi:hypothetical protein